MTRRALLLGLLLASGACGPDRPAIRCKECDCTGAKTSALACPSVECSSSDRIIASMPIDLPRAATNAPDAQVFFAVDLTRDGRVLVDGQAISSPSEIPARARSAREKNPEIRATIRADKDVAHGRVMEIIDLLKQAGIHKIAFATPATPP